MNETIRVIEWFSKRNGRLVGEEEIKDFDLELFKKIFDHCDDDDPYIYGGSYQVLQNHVPIIQQYIKHKINLDKFNYFFATYEDNTQ